MFNVSESAITKFYKEIKDGEGIFIDLKTTGCNGFSYNIKPFKKETFNFDNIYQENIGGILFTFKMEHWDILKDLQINYIKDGFNQKFEFNNPAEKGVCGCGSSFRV